MGFGIRGRVEELKRLGGVVVVEIWMMKGGFWGVGPVIVQITLGLMMIDQYLYS